MRFKFLIVLLLISVAFIACDKDNLSGDTFLKISAKIKNGVTEKSSNQITSA